MRTRRHVDLLLIAALGAAAAACDGDPGAKGASGEPGSDGTNGTNGTPGTPGDAGPPGQPGTSGDAGSCTVKDNGDGTTTVTCADGTTVTIKNGSGCTVVTLGATCKRIICEDGTSEIVCAPIDPNVNLSAVHNPASSSYDKACLSCHIDKLTEKSKSATVPGFHQRKLGTSDGGAPVIPGATPDAKCVFCHKTVDMSPNRSGAGLRRQVDPTLCAGCHTTGTYDYYLP